MTKQRIARVLLSLIVGTAGLQLIGMESAGAAALSDVSWSASKAHPSDTGVRYTWSFTTATAATIGTVTFTVPAGTGDGGSLTVADNYGLSAGTAARSGTTVTFTVTTPAAIATNTPILVAIDGFTNTNVANGYTSTVTTNSTAPAAVDTAVSNTVTFDNNSTVLTVVIARTITFSNNTDNILMLMDPSLPALTNRVHTATSLSIATNAANGYTLYAKATDLTGSGKTLPRLSAGTPAGVADASFNTNTWGFRVPSAPTNGGNGTIVRVDDLATDKWAGHTAADQDIVTQSGPTNGDVVPVSHRVKIDYLTPAVTYTSTITYTAAPSY